MKERLVLFIKYLGIPVSAFERNVGLSNAYIANFKGNMSADKLEGILNYYPELNKEWLLTGRGEMLQSVTQTVGDISNSQVSGVNVNGKDIQINPNIYDRLLGIIDADKCTIKKQQEQIDRLLSLLEKK